MEKRPVVIISGFGPFGKHNINASWASVQQIPKQHLEERLNIKLISVEIPVVYNAVDDLVPSLWKQHNPKLVIHVGVSDLAEELVLETIAHGKNYGRCDYEGKCPENEVSVCCRDSTEKISCGLDVESICKEYNKLNKFVKASVSTDAGRYLCEYIYYTSLSIDSSRTLFVHVPDIQGPFTEQNIAEGLESILVLCLQQLDKCAE